MNKMRIHILCILCIVDIKCELFRDDVLKRHRDDNDIKAKKLVNPMVIMMRIRIISLIISDFKEH